MIVTSQRASHVGSGDAPSTPALDWMIRACQEILELVEFHEGSIQASEAVRVGWSSLREVFRTWGIDNREQLTSWLRLQEFPATLPGNHISARAQEFLLAEAGRHDARVGLIDVVCVSLAIHMGREAFVARPEILQDHEVQARHPASVSMWEELDRFSMEDIFRTRVPMLKSCPHFLRGRMRESFQVALRERHRA